MSARIAGQPRNAWGATEGGDAGVTLPEVLVSMLIASALFIALSTLVLSSTRSNQFTLGKTTSTADARIAMEAMTRSLRVAVAPNGYAAAIASADSSSVKFYTSMGTTTGTTDPTPSQVYFYYSAAKHCLMREITPGTVSGGSVTFPSAKTVADCVARGDVNVSGSPLFTYYPLSTDGTGQVSTTPYATSAISGNLANIASVAISLSITDTAHSSVNPSTLQDQVTLINVATALQAGS